MTKFVKNVLVVMLFITSFNVVGYLLPQIYYQYFDRTEYLKFQDSVEVTLDKYKVCDDVELTFRREAAEDLEYQSITQLVLYQIYQEEAEPNTFKKLFFEPQYGIIKKGATNIKIAVPLPCAVEPGEYYFEGAYNYQVKNIKRNTYWTSERFDVIKTP